MHCWWECKNDTILWRKANHTYLPQVHLSIDPTISLLAVKPPLPIHLHMYKAVRSTNVLIAWKQPKCPSIKGWLDYGAVTQQSTLWLKKKKKKRKISKYIYGNFYRLIFLKSQIKKRQHRVSCFLFIVSKVEYKIRICNICTWLNLHKEIHER